MKVRIICGSYGYRTKFGVKPVMLGETCEVDGMEAAAWQGWALPKLWMRPPRRLPPSLHRLPPSRNITTPLPRKVSQRSPQPPIWCPKILPT